MIPDINSLILKLQRERYLLIYAVNILRTREKFLNPNWSKFGNYLTESTYVLFGNAILTKSLLVVHSPRIRVVIYDHLSGNNTNTTQYNWSRNLTRTIYVCLVMDNERFVVSFVIIPGFNSNKRNTKFYG